MTKVSKEIAEKEVNSWIQSKGFTMEECANLEGTINKLINAVMDGAIQINTETNILTQKLKFPFGKEIKISELVFQPHITVGDLQKHTFGINVDKDLYGQSIAHICAATGESKDIISKMNNRDFKLADSIVVFFML